jgi:hypothetical protein
MKSLIRLFTLSFFSVALFAVAAGSALASGGGPSADSAGAAQQTKEFSMELTARSAKWAKQPGEGLYTLTLSGVSKSVKVRSISTSGKVSVSPFPLKGIAPYWDFYGEVTDQFTDGGKSADAPLAVIAVRGVNGVGLVQLPELKSSSASKLVYTARLLADTDKARYQVREIGGRYFLKNDLGDITAVKVPRNKNDVHVVIDMPRRIDQPDAAPEAPAGQAQAATAAKKASPPARASMPTMTCYGNRSSYLAACAQGNIVTAFDKNWGWEWDRSLDARAHPDLACADVQPSGGRSATIDYVESFGERTDDRRIIGASRPAYIYYQGVGIVGMQFRPGFPSRGWRCGASAPGYTRSTDPDRRRAAQEGMSSVIYGAPSGPFGENGWGYEYGRWYGVYTNAVTYYASSRCSAFLAAWRAGGSCW